MYVLPKRTYVFRIEGIQCAQNNSTIFVRSALLTGTVSCAIIITERKEREDNTMKTTINTNVTLTPMERKALAITGRPIEEILLLYRYRAIVPHTERALLHSYSTSLCRP